MWKPGLQNLWEAWAPAPALHCLSGDSGHFLVPGICPLILHLLPTGHPDGGRPS